MITPRQTRLVRVASLPAMHRALAAILETADPLAARDTAVLVPTRSAAAQLRRTLEALRLIDPLGEQNDDSGSGVLPAGLVLPDLLTREDWYAAMHARHGACPRALGAVEREAMAARAAVEAIDAGAAPPFRIRPRLVAELLTLYDGLRRHGRTVDDFDRLITGALEPSAGIDRGARRLLEQTRFLAATCRAYERLVAESAAIDEASLRDHLLATPSARPYRHVIVTVGDQAIEPHGLWPADFDLLARLDGLERVDVVATERMLSTGFHERLHELLPGIEETRFEWRSGLPTLIAPPMPANPRGTPSLWFVARDREEELGDAARRLARLATARDGRLHARRPASLDAVAFVYQRPLPYLYLARQVLDRAGLPYSASDTLPLAAEPYVAAFDAVMSLVLRGWPRHVLVDVLSSPHLSFAPDRRRLPAAAVSALDTALRDRGFTSGYEPLVRILSALTAVENEAEADPHRRQARMRRRARELEREAAEAALRVCDRLAGFDREAPLGEHADGLLRLLEEVDVPLPPEDERAERQARASTAVRSLLAELRAAGRDGDRPVPFRDAAAWIRRWLEVRTFAPRRGTGGVQLVDATAARYGAFSHVFLLGAVEGEWPAGRPRDIFYPSRLLRQLGWPSAEARQAADRAAVFDLLELASREVAISTFTLEDDAIVAPAPILEDLDELELPIDREPATTTAQGAAVRHDRAAAGAAAAAPRALLEWVELRRARTPASDPAYHGRTSSPGVSSHSVTQLERYLECPFRYFASHVLRLTEEDEPGPGPSPRERGRFVHEVFHAFFDRWHASGHGAITRAALPDAIALFEEVLDRELERLPESERALERALLAGSAAGAGAGERVFRLEAERPLPVIDRRLEYSLDGEYTVPERPETRVRLRGIADRVDLLGDGTLRVVDYKTGRPPDRDRSLQLPIYAWCAEERLLADEGRRYRVAEAAYLTLAGPSSAQVAIAGEEAREATLAEGRARMLSALDGIAHGIFPPRPADARLCNTCAYAAVCRKDYVEDDVAEEAAAG